MAVSFDTYDAESEIHPRNKVIPSQRLATAGLNVAYGLKEYPTNGPFPDFIDINQVQNGKQIDITYDKPFIWNPTETEGFYICTQPDFCNIFGGWQKVNKFGICILTYLYTQTRQ